MDCASHTGLAWSDRSLVQPDEQEAAGGVGEWSEVCFRNAVLQFSYVPMM